MFNIIYEYFGVEALLLDLQTRQGENRSIKRLDPPPPPPPPSSENSEGPAAFNPSHLTV